MITREDDVDIHALRRQGWTITAIARHVGRDRKTVRDYLNGKREPGVRRRAADPFAPFVEYVTARLVEDPHLWAVTLFDELQPLGFDAVVSDLDPGDPGPPAAPGLRRLRAGHRTGERGHRASGRGGDPVGLAGSARPARQRGGGGRWRICWSGRWRIRAGGAATCRPSMDQPHLVEGLDRISRGLGGVTRQWRFDRMATVCQPGSGRITATFSGVAKHYGVMIKICPPRAGHRKGVVEKVNHTAAQRWWRTLADELTRRAGPGRL